MLTFDPNCITYSQMNLIFNARIYYRRLTTWTRTFLLSRYFGIGTADAIFQQLYRESLAIGDMLQVVFGREASERYSTLVSNFAIALRELVTAQLSGDTQAMQANIDRMYQNVDERATYLSTLNPYWSKEEYIQIFRTYIQFTLEIMNAIAAKDNRRYIELQDQFAAHTNLMGDVFAQGLYFYLTSGTQNPSSQMPPSGQGCVTQEEMNTIYQIRTFWFDLVTWTRNYLISRFMGIGNPEEVFARLKQVPEDYIAELREVFGDEVADRSAQALNKYLDLFEAFLSAQMSGNIEEINRTTQLMYQNANQRAANIAAANPFWTEEEWRNRLYQLTRYTIESSATLLRGDYTQNIDLFSRLLDLAESTSTYFAQGLFRYLNSTVSSMPE